MGIGLLNRINNVLVADPGKVEYPFAKPEENLLTFNPQLQIAVKFYRNFYFLANPGIVYIPRTKEKYTSMSVGIIYKFR